MIYNELNFTTYSTENHYGDTVSEDNYTLYSTYLDQNFIKLFCMVRYTREINRSFSAFANLGAGWGMPLGGSTITVEDNYFYGRWSRNSFDAGLSRGQEMGVAGGLGVSWWKLNFETRFDKPILAQNSFPFYRFYFLLGFTF